MNRDHLNADQLAAYRQRQLPPNELLAASDHLASCAECRSALLRLPSDDLSAESADVTYEELVAWIDDTLEPIERRELQTRISKSPTAQRELADLERFEAEMNQPPVSNAKNIVPVFFGRWALPLAAAFALTMGGLWWATRDQSDSGSFVRLKDGGRDLRITRSGDLDQFAHLSQPIRDAVKEAATQGRVQVPAEIAALVGRTSRLAGAAPEGGPAFRVLAPIATALRAGVPEFRWTTVPEATAYRIRVADTATGEIVMTGTIPGTQAVWTPAESLKAGATYEWEIEALRGEQVLAKAPEPPQPEARFAVISDAKRLELEQIQEGARGSHLVSGVAAVQAGLLDDAVAEFDELAKENPESEIPKRLIEQIHRAKRSAQSE
jgi:hypothetical protein